MKTEREKRLEIQLLTEKIERISGKKIILLKEVDSIFKPLKIDERVKQYVKSIDEKKKEIRLTPGSSHQVYNFVCEKYPEYSVLLDDVVSIDKKNKIVTYNFIPTSYFLLRQCYPDYTLVRQNVSEYLKKHPELTVSLKPNTFPIQAIKETEKKLGRKLLSKERYIVTAQAVNTLSKVELTLGRKIRKGKGIKTTLQDWETNLSTISLNNLNRLGTKLEITWGDMIVYSVEGREEATGFAVLGQDEDGNEFMYDRKETNNPGAGQTTLFSLNGSMSITEAVKVPKEEVLKKLKIS